jgi:hypothetical protein
MNREDHKKRVEAEYKKKVKDQAGKIRSLLMGMSPGDVTDHIISRLANVEIFMSELGQRVAFLYEEIEGGETPENDLLLGSVLPGLTASPSNSKTKGKDEPTN